MTPKKRPPEWLQRKRESVPGFFHPLPRRFPTHPDAKTATIEVAVSY
jgi:hypothetical protein